MFSFSRSVQVSLSIFTSFSFLLGCVTESHIQVEGESVSRTVANTPSLALSGSQATSILQINFNELGLKDVTAEQMQLGVLLLQERVRRYGEQTDKVNAFAKSYGVTILAMRSLSLNSFSQLGLDSSQVLANLAFFQDIESKILGGQTIAQLQKSIRGPLFLLNILYVSKFEPQIHEYGYLSEALDQMLENQTPAEVLPVAIPFAVYMRAVRVANYSVTANEETAFIGFISQQIQNGTSPVAIGDYAIQSLILFRAIRLGYVPMTSTYEKDLAEVIAPMLAQNKSADQIVGELVNNVVLTCGTAAVSEMKSMPARANKEMSRITFNDLLNKLQPSRGLAQTKKKIVMNPQRLKLLKTKKSLSANVSVLVPPRNVKFNTNNLKANASYMVMVPKASYDKAIQERLIADVRRMAPTARIVKVLQQGFNVILVENLNARDLGTLVRFGYEIAPNSKPVFHGLQSCNASQFSSDVSPVSDSVRQIGAVNLHSQGFRGQGIKIGIVDTGLDIRHPDFECTSPQSERCRIKIGTKSGYSADPWVDSSGHGTHVSSIAAGKNGVAPESQVLLYKLDSYYDIIEVLSSSVAIDKPKVLNMSFSFPEDRNSMMSQLIDQVVRENDISVAAAAGNCSLKRGSADDGECGYGEWDSQGLYSVADRRNVISSPGIAKRAIAVGVIDRNDSYGTTISVSGPTLDGTSLVKPDLVAPGKLICAAGVSGIEEAYGCGIYHVNRGGFFGWCDQEHAVLSGSSMSAPMVTGSIALLKQKYPHWNTDEIKSALRLSANHQAGNLSAFGIFERGVGRLDVFKASLITGYPPVVRVDKVEVQNSSSGKSLALTGAVYDRDPAGKGLREFRIYIGKGEKPTSFIPLKSFARSVGSLQTNESLLGISSIPSCYQGKYILKIEGEDGDGNVASDYVMVNL